MLRTAVRPLFAQPGVAAGLHPKPFSERYACG